MAQVGNCPRFKKIKVFEIFKEPPLRSFSIIIQCQKIHESVPLRLENSFFSELETSKNPIFKKLKSQKKSHSAEKSKGGTLRSRLFFAKQKQKKAHPKIQTPCFTATHFSITPSPKLLGEIYQNL